MKLQTHKGVNVFFSPLAAFCDSSNARRAPHRHPHPRWGGCKSLLFCTLRGCVHSARFQLTSDNPSVVTSRFISFKSQAASISPYFQPAGVSAVCAFTRRNAQRLRPKTFPWKWSPWTQPKNDTVSTEHPSIHPSEIPVKHLPASPRPRANPPQPPARRRLPPGA